VLGVLAQAEAARNTTSSDEIRAKVVSDTAWALQHAVTTVALRTGLFPGPALGDFTQEVLRQFRHVCSWAIQTGGDKTARYDPHYDAEPSGPLALTAADD
jgi:hypothetical protein